MGVALLLTALAGEAAELPMQELTWQEANKRSAVLLRNRETLTEGAELARAAFDLYPQQTNNYSAQNHAQLLLNLVDARNRASSRKVALTELERGIETIKQRTGPRDPVLVDLWRQGSALYGPQSERYFKQAVDVAEQAWGAGDPRSIKLLLSMAHDRRAMEGYAWAKAKFRLARERAEGAGTDSALVAEIDLMLAKIEMESGNISGAIKGYETLIGRLEQRPDRDQNETLALAYLLLEYSYEETKNPVAAAEVRQKRSVLRVPVGEKAAGNLVPLFRVVPAYPRAALSVGKQGFVEFLVDVNADGTVASLRVLRSDPPGLFDESASRAVRKWKFKPKIVDGQPVASTGTQRIDYLIEDADYEFRRGAN